MPCWRRCDDLHQRQAATSAPVRRAATQAGTADSDGARALQLQALDIERQSPVRAESEHHFQEEYLPRLEMTAADRRGRLV